MNTRWLRISYWVGAIVDGVMIVPMLSPSIGGAVFGIDDFHPGPEYRYAMAVGASLMAGWTTLLLWADRKPFERRAVLLLTMFPVIIGLMAAGAYAVTAGLIPPQKMLPTWVLQTALLVLFGVSYRRAKPVRS